MWIIPATIIIVMFCIGYYQWLKDERKLGAADTFLKKATEHLQETIRDNKKSKDALNEAMSILESAKKNLEDSEVDRRELDLERKRLLEIATRLCAKTVRAGDSNDNNNDGSIGSIGGDSGSDSDSNSGDTIMTKAIADDVKNTNNPPNFAQRDKYLNSTHRF